MNETDNHSAATTLAEALSAEGIHLPSEQVARLDQYRKLLWSWNEKMNLTRHTTLEKFVSRDVVDSLRLAELLDRGARVLDVGSGGGVPGVMIAVLRPDVAVSLAESTSKKARAAEAMVGQLGLSVPVYATRAEDVLELSTYDVLVARGVASLKKLLGWLAPYWDAFDELLLVKGPNWVEERGEARHLGLLKGLQLRKAASYPTGRSGAESVILRIWRPGAEL